MEEALMTLSPTGTISDSADIAGAIVYLAEAHHVTVEVLHVDAGAHIGPRSMAYPSSTEKPGHVTRPLSFYCTVFLRRRGCFSRY
jgi:hypothetical protein